MPTIRVADFTVFPGGRFRRDGPFSGEQYREEILAPALMEAIRHRTVLTVELAGTKGYGSSFLEEAFGGLVREGLVTRSDCASHLRFSAESRLFEPYRQLAEQYLRNARPALAVA